MADELKLSFEPKKLDYIFTVLSQRPFAEVQDIIFDIRQQVARQQNPGVFPVPSPEGPKDEAA